VKPLGMGCAVLVLAVSALVGGWMAIDDSHSVAAIDGASDAQTPTLSSEVNPLSRA
jgi:hypothetical protein